MLGFITQYFRGQTLYLRKFRVSMKEPKLLAPIRRSSASFIWTPDKDDAMRLSTSKGVEVMKQLRGFCSPAMVDRRGCVITTGGAPKTRAQLNAELKQLRITQRRFRNFRSSLYYYELWMRKQARAEAKAKEKEERLVLRTRQRETKRSEITLKVKPRFTVEELTKMLATRVEKMVLKQRQR